MIRRRALLRVFGAGTVAVTGCLESGGDRGEEIELDDGEEHEMEVDGDPAVSDVLGDPDSPDVHRLFLWNSGSRSQSLSIEESGAEGERGTTIGTYDLDADSYALISLYDADEYDLVVIGDGFDHPVLVLEEWFEGDCWTTVVKVDTEVLGTRSMPDEACLEESAIRTPQTG
jgi:hypothetical protein